MFLHNNCPLQNPYSTLADGTCLYNACSIALTGKDPRVSAVLQCLSSIELYENAQYYANHPIIQLMHKKEAFTSTKNAFAMCLSDSAFLFLKHKVLLQRLLKKHSLMHRILIFLLMCMFASFNCRIESYYPVGNDLSPRDDWNSLEKMFNCTIFPKHQCDGEHMPQRYLLDGRIPTSKNHFVALCQPINNIEPEPGEHYFSPILPQQPASTSTSSTVVRKPASTSTLTLSTDVKKQAPTSFLTFSIDVKKPSTSTLTSSKNMKQQASTASTSSMNVKVDIHPAPPTARKLQVVVPGVKRKQLCLDTLLPRKKMNDGGQPTKKEKSIPTKISTRVDAPPESSVKKDSAFHPKDVHFYVGKASSLSDAEKYDLMCNV